MSLIALLESQLYNYAIATASTINVILLCISAGIAVAFGNDTLAEKEEGYRWLIVFFTIMEMICVSPFLYTFAKNPRQGLRVPDGTPFWQVGPK